MKNAILRVAAAISICTLVQPVMAAEDFRPPEAGQRQKLSAYAGGTIRLALGGHQRAVPRAALAMGFMQKSGSPGTMSPVRARVVEMVSFGGSKEAGPSLSIVGVPTHGFERKLGISTLGAVAIGGLLAVGALVAVASSSSTVPDNLVTGL